MSYTVILDAGHGGSDYGATYNGRKEKDDNLKLALAVGKILEENCIDVEYTRTKDIYNTPYEKAVIGNNSGADLFVSFHRNATPLPNTSSGVETLVFNDTGLKAKLARNVNKQLEKVGFDNRGVVERPNLVVLKRTKIPSILIETGFIDNDDDNALFDARFNDIANAIAQGIINTIGDQCEEKKQLYRVQVGAYKSRDNADELLDELKSQGYPAFIVLEDGIYKVQVGAYAVLDNAIKMEEKLRKAGYDTYITT